MFIVVYKTLKSIFALPFAALGLPPHACRFTPSCSQYCSQAFIKFGPLRGSSLCVRRILRCHPGTPPGHDPLPA